MSDICLCTPKWKAIYTKDKFYDELVHEWDIKGTKKLTLRMRDFMVKLEKKWMNLRVYMGEMELESKIWYVECC